MMERAQWNRAMADKQIIRKRQALLIDVLTPERVQELGRKIGIQVNRSAAKTKRRILSSGKLNDDWFFQFLSVFELQEACRKLGILPGRDSRALRDQIRRKTEGWAPVQGTYERSGRDLDLPDQAKAEFQARRRSDRRKTLKYRLGRFFGVTFGALLGAAVSGGLSFLLTTDEETLLGFAGFGAAAAGLLLWRKIGRYFGSLLYGGGYIAATLLAHKFEFIVLTEESHAKLALVWSFAVAFGFTAGLSEEMRDDM